MEITYPENKWTLTINSLNGNDIPISCVGIGDNLFDINKFEPTPKPYNIIINDKVVVMIDNHNNTKGVAKLRSDSEIEKLNDKFNIKTGIMIAYLRTKYSKSQIHNHINKYFFTIENFANYKYSQLGSYHKDIIDSVINDYNMYTTGKMKKKKVIRHNYILNLYL